MKNILKIYFKDLKSIVTHFVPLLICGSLILLGSCYAIFNIYSNWDPYANTGNLTILVYNADKGETLEDGTEMNQGDTIVKNLKKNKAIHWVEADTKNALIEAVTDGKVYAGIVIDDDFTHDMLHFLSAKEGFSKPQIKYYENDKKNAIALKVTDTAVETLQVTINKTFLETVVKVVFQTTNSLVKDEDSASKADLMIEKLTGIRDNLNAYQELIGQFLEGNETLHEKLSGAQSDMDTAGKQINSGIADIKKVEDGVADTKASYQEYSAKTEALMKDLQTSLDNVSTDIQQSRLLNEDLDELNRVLNQTVEDVSVLQRNSLNLNQLYTSDSMKSFLASVSALSESMNTVQQIQIQAPDLTALYQALDNSSGKVKDLQNTYSNVIVPELNNVLNNMSTVLANVTGTMETLGKMTNAAGNIFGNLDTTIDYTDQSFTQVQSVLTDLIQKIDGLLEKVQGASENEKVEMLVNFLTGDADSYSKYFSQIIQVDTKVIFPVENYGSACSVFYVALALYVLALLLASEFRTGVDTTGMKNVKRYETYFGRYLIFFTMGFVQSVFLSAFCVFVMKIQCEHVLAFFFVNAFISFVFTNIIYASVKIFGMMYGRTFATILVIFQMSTGGCTYSVEQIPTSMRWMNPYMPFTYCSNALREVCFGYTDYDLSIYLGKLLIFAVIAILAGIFLAPGTEKIMRYIDQRLLDTGLMGVEEGGEEEEPAWDEPVRRGGRTWKRAKRR